MDVEYGRGTRPALDTHNPHTHTPHQSAHTPRARPGAEIHVSVDAIGLSQCESVCVHTDTGTYTRLKSEPRRGECLPHP